MTVVRAAMTEVCNVYRFMPETVDGLSELGDQLEEIRRANVEHHVGLIEKAAGQGVRVIGLGELFAGPYFALRRDAVWRGMAEDAAEGPTVLAMREAAARLGMVVVAPIYEKAGEKRFNTAVVIDADGAICGKYRKCHVPCGSNEEGSFDERFYYEPSDGEMGNDSGRLCSTNPYLPVFETAVGRVGVAICYDRHFEGVMSGLAKGGAQMVFSPAVTFGRMSRRLWELEFLVDAARHGVYICGSNRRGVERPWGQEYFGGSYFAGPAERVEEVRDEAGLVMADLDLGALEQGGDSGWDLEGDTRPEVYGGS